MMGLLELYILGTLPLPTSSRFESHDRQNKDGTVSNLLVR